MIIYKWKSVICQLAKEEAFEFKGTSKGKRWLVISAMKVQKKKLKMYWISSKCYEHNEKEKARTN